MSVLTKSEVRISMTKILKSITPNARLSQSEHVLEMLRGIPAYLNAKNVALFLSMKTEVETRPIMDDCTQSKRTILVPRIISDCEFEFVMLDSAATVDSLPLDKWGIPIPPFDDVHRMLLHPEFTPDVIIVPGVAFDPHCQRLGHGKGYYGLTKFEM